MREIKFRGKGMDGKWHIGNLMLSEPTVGETYGEAFIAVPFANSSNVRKEIINPETIGQYTGLKDNNGKEMYEGDILRHTYLMYGEPLEDTKDLEVLEGEEIGSIIYKRGSFGFISANGKSEIYGMLEPTEDDMLGMEKFDFEIIGNIHDNPNLLTDED